MSSSLPKPTRLSDTSAAKLTFDNVSLIKHIDCTTYNQCLTIADNKGWAGFACADCRAFERISKEQQEMDVMGLLVALKASDYVLEGGSCNRRRGVKDGTHRTRRESIISRLEANLEHDELVRLVI